MSRLCSCFSELNLQSPFFIFFFFAAAAARARPTYPPLNASDRALRPSQPCSSLAQSPIDADIVSSASARSAKKRRGSRCFRAAGQSCLHFVRFLSRDAGKVAVLLSNAQPPQLSSLAPAPRCRKHTAPNFLCAFEKRPGLRRKDLSCNCHDFVLSVQVLD